jgi:hypothetical protein
MFFNVAQWSEPWRKDLTILALRVRISLWDVRVPV